MNRLNSSFGDPCPLQSDLGLQQLRLGLQDINTSCLLRLGQSTYGFHHLFGRLHHLFVDPDAILFGFGEIKLRPQHRGPRFENAIKRHLTARETLEAACEFP